MKLMKLLTLVLLVLSMDLALNINARANGDADQDSKSLQSLDFSNNEIDDEWSTYLHKQGRFYPHYKKMKHSRRLTCNKYPRICHAKGSPGPDCCKKKCVNVLHDRLNCGVCGMKCKFNEICCHGRCVNPSFSRSHCGGCNNRCSKGSFCVFGLCNYA